MSTYAIGDIQGCFNEFKNLLEEINFDPDSDELWLAGDLINRGPNNLETIKFIMSLKQVKVVLGNHDLHFLAVANGSHKLSRSDTLSDLLNAIELPEIIQWMRQLPLAYFDPRFDCLLVHAGLPSIWSIDQALSYAREVESILQGERCSEFFDKMYGNLPNKWTAEVTGWDRIRLITNYLTRLRYCTQDGEMELTHKAEIQPEGYAPWFSFPREQNTPVLFGHWAAIEGVTHQQNMIALDTGCVWGRALTAYRLDDKQFFSVPAIR